MFTGSRGMRRLLGRPCCRAGPAEKLSISGLCWPGPSRRWPVGTGIPATSPTPAVRRRLSPWWQFRIRHCTTWLWRTPSSFSERGVQTPSSSRTGREVQVRRESLAPLNGLTAGTPEYRRMRAIVIEELRGRRNQASGYWIAKDDPAAAAEAVTGTVPLDEVDSFALLSDGASRVVDPYGLLDWRAFMQVLHSTGPRALLRRLRQYEVGRTDGPPLDDASVTFAEFRRPPRGGPAVPRQPAERTCAASSRRRDAGAVLALRGASGLPAPLCWSAPIAAVTP